MPRLQRVSVPEATLRQFGPPVSTWSIIAVHDRFNQNTIDLMPDTLIEEQRNDQKASMLRWWVAEVGLPWLEKKAQPLKMKLNIPNGKRIELHSLDGYNIIAVYNEGCFSILAYRYDPPGEQYEMVTMDDTARWDGPTPVPTLYSEVVVRSFGKGRVMDFFKKNGKFGARISLDQVPLGFPHVLPYYMALGEEIQRVV